MEERKSVKLSTRFSRILSVLFHPVFMPVYGLMIIFFAPTFMVHLPVSMKRIIFLLAAINLTVVPLALMPLFKYRNIISSYHMDKRSEQIVPLAIGTMMYIVTTVIFYSYQIPVMIKSFMLAATVTSALILIITFRWKISIHSVGMGALLASVIVLSLRMRTNLIVIWVPLLLLSGLVMTVRLYLESHKPAHVYSGFLLGFLTVFIVMMVF
jgi:hypothetical protein